MTENRLNISESNGSPDTNGTGDGRTGHSETGYSETGYSNSNSKRQDPLEGNLQQPTESRQGEYLIPERRKA